MTNIRKAVSIMAVNEAINLANKAKTRFPTAKTDEEKHKAMLDMCMAFSVLLEVTKLTLEEPDEKEKENQDSTMTIYVSLN